MHTDLRSKTEYISVSYIASSVDNFSVFSKKRALWLGSQRASVYLLKTNIKFDIDTIFLWFIIDEHLLSVRKMPIMRFQ